MRLASCLLAAALLVSCAGADPVASRPGRLTLWAHSGTPAEQAATRALVAGYEQAHPGISVDLTVVTEGDYNDALHAAAAAGTLPDVIDVDGPLVASYAYQHALTPLDELLPAAVPDRMLPSLRTQGTWAGQLWAVGAFESGLAVYADRSRLTQAGVRVPTGPQDAWTADEMTRSLAALATGDPDGKVLDLRGDYGNGEWLTYGFAPLLSSAGAALVDPVTGRASGTLDSPAAVRAMTLLRAWGRYVDPNADGTAFADRRVALSWVGHWTYTDYAKALGRDLVLVPLPDLGLGSKTGQGSWAWAVAATSTRKQAAADLLSWLTDDAAAAASAAANGSLPGTVLALARSASFVPGSPLRLFAQQAGRPCATGTVTRACTTVPRPVTPGYPTVTTAFAAAVADVLQGGDPKAALTRAAHTIDADLDANSGYRG